MVNSTRTIIIDHIVCIVSSLEIVVALITLEVGENPAISAATTIVASISTSIAISASISTSISVAIPILASLVVHHTHTVPLVQLFPTPNTVPHWATQQPRCPPNMG